MTPPDKQPLGIPTVMVLADTDSMGRLYYLAANVLADNLLKLMRRTEFSPYDLEIVANDLKFHVVRQNGQAVPFPKGASRKKADAEPRHVPDDA